MMEKNRKAFIKSGMPGHMATDTRNLSNNRVLKANNKSATQSVNPYANEKNEGLVQNQKQRSRTRKAIKNLLAINQGNQSGKIKQKNYQSQPQSVERALKESDTVSELGNYTMAIEKDSFKSPLQKRHAVS